MVALSSPTILPCRQDALYSAPAMMHRLWYFSIRHCGMVCLENMGPTYDILFQSDENQNFTKSIFGYNKLKKLSFFVIANPAGGFMGLREAIPRS